jgi:phosphotransacetylase
MAVAAPTTEIALAGALDAARRSLIEPILVGPSREIRALAERMGRDIGKTQLVEAADEKKNPKKKKKKKIDLNP